MQGDQYVCLQLGDVGGMGTSLVLLLFVMNFTFEFGKGGFHLLARFLWRPHLVWDVETWDVRTFLLGVTELILDSDVSLESRKCSAVVVGGAGTSDAELVSQT